MHASIRLQNKSKAACLQRTRKGTDQTQIVEINNKTSTRTRRAQSRSTANGAAATQARRCGASRHGAWRDAVRHHPLGPKLIHRDPHHGLHGLRGRLGDSSTGARSALKSAPAGCSGAVWTRRRVLLEALEACASDGGGSWGGRGRKGRREHEMQ